MDNSGESALRYKEGKGDSATAGNRPTRSGKSKPPLHDGRAGRTMSIPYILPQPGIPEIDIPSYDPFEDEDDE
jgi:hypothetical protein